MKPGRETTMKRYDITHWADFVRDTAESTQAEAMAEYLQEASREERRDAELLRRVAAVGRQDRENKVPESAVRIAKALGSVRRTRTSGSQLPFRILFDSFGQPAVAGVRGSQPRDRHLVVEAGDFVVDVRFEPGELSRLGGASGAAVTGQVLRREGSQPLSDLPVLLLAGDEAVGASRTGESGEFQADGLPEAPLNLWVRVEGGEFIDFPLSAT